MPLGCARGIERYHVVEKVGEGTYGVVYKAMDLHDKRTVALKKIRLDLDEDGIPTTAIREVSLLKELRHENVIRLIDVVQLPRSLYLVFDLVDTDLKQCMDTQVCGLAAPTVQSYMHQLLSGIAYCHSRRVLHRDLKPQNLLIERCSGLLRLADFGLSRTFRLPARSYTNEVVTLWYRSPEVLLGGSQCTTALDLWSAGCIFGEMLSGKPLFPGESEVDQIFKTFRTLGTPVPTHAPTLCSLPAFQSVFPRWRGEPLIELLRAGVCAGSFGLGAEEEAHAVSLLEGLLAYEPSQRLTAREALQHPYFTYFRARGAADGAWQAAQGAGSMSTPAPAQPPQQAGERSLRSPEPQRLHQPHVLPAPSPGQPAQAAHSPRQTQPERAEAEARCPIRRSLREWSRQFAATKPSPRPRWPLSQPPQPPQQRSLASPCGEARARGEAGGEAGGEAEGGRAQAGRAHLAFGRGSVDINAAAELLPTGNTPLQPSRSRSASDAAPSALLRMSPAGAPLPLPGS